MKPVRRLLAVLAIGLTFVPPAPAGGGRSILDFRNVLAAWLGEFGWPHLDYGPPVKDADVDAIALDLLDADGPLLIPAPLRARIARDVAAIRSLEPALTAVPHTSGWLPDRLIVALEADASRHEFSALNDYLLVEHVRAVGPPGTELRWYEVTLPRPVNVHAVAALYLELQGVAFADPIGLVGAPTAWRPQPLRGGVWRWTVQVGWLDCQAGCICRMVWTFDVTDKGAATLVSFTRPQDPICDDPPPIDPRVEPMR